MVLFAGICNQLTTHVLVIYPRLLFCQHCNSHVVADLLLSLLPLPNTHLVCCSFPIVKVMWMWCVFSADIQFLWWRRQQLASLRHHNIVFISSLCVITRSRYVLVIACSFCLRTIGCRFAVCQRLLGKYCNWQVFVHCMAVQSLMSYRP